MDRLFLYKIKIVLAFLCIFLGVQLVNSQSITSPNLGFGNACFTPGESPITGLPYNSYNVSASYSGSFSGGNTFQLRLSDKDGDLNNGVIIAEKPISEISAPPLIEFENFSFPETVGSDLYRLDVVATDFPGQTIGQRSQTFGAYFYDGTTYVLEPRCLSGGGTFVAEPSDFDSYLWYKVVGNSNVLIVGETSNTLTVTEEGRYFFTTEYGACQSASRFPQSNFSDVVASAGSEVSINQSGPISVCSDEQVTFNTTISPGAGINYSWYKDDVLVEDITDPEFTIIGSSQAQTLTVTGLGMEGSYRFEAGSNSADDCSLQSEEVEIILRNPKVTITSELTVLLLPPGEPKTLIAQKIRGTNESYTWFKDGSPLPDSNNLTYDATEAGTYTISITADSPCPEGNTVFAKEEVLVVPAENLTVTIGYQDPAYVECELSETVLEVTEVTTTVSDELIVLDQSLLQSLVVDWQRDGESTEETAQSILINGASENGSYTAVIAGATSNSLPVILGLDSFVITKTPEVLEIDGKLELSLGLEETTGYSFQWFRNLTEEIPNSNFETIEVTEPGTYNVQVFLDTCQGTVSPVVVTTGSPVIPSVITPNGDGINDDWVLPVDYTQKSNVEVNIYASNGELDYSTVNYSGEWPQESKSKSVGTVYYYVINVDNSPVEQGSITIIR